MRISDQYDRYTENNQYNQASPRPPLPFLLKQHWGRKTGQVAYICLVVFTTVLLITEGVLFNSLNNYYDFF